MDNKPITFLYTLTLALWVGGMTIFTFVVTPAIFRTYDRDTAGRIVGSLFDGYFYYNLSVMAAAIVLVVLAARLAGRPASRLPVILIAAAILMNCAVTFKVYPEIRAVKARVGSFVTTPKGSDIRKEFSKLHAISAVLNLLMLADGAALLYINTAGKDNRR